MIGVEIAAEGDRIEAEVGQRSRRWEGVAAPERTRDSEAVRNGRDGCVVVSRAAHDPDVGRVVGADRRLDPVPAKASRLTSRSRLETDVSMMSTTSCADRLDRIEEFLARANRASVPSFAAPARGLEARSHVGVLGVGEDEIRARCRRPRECARVSRRADTWVASAAVGRKRL